MLVFRFGNLKVYAVHPRNAVLKTDRKCARASFNTRQGAVSRPSFAGLLQHPCQNGGKDSKFRTRVLLSKRG